MVDGRSSGQHGVAEAVDHVRELGDDRRIDRGVEPVGNDEDVDVGLDLTGEFLEHEVLYCISVPNFGWQALAIPDQRAIFLGVGSAAVVPNHH
jgi:hypothetical protein